MEQNLIQETTSNNAVSLDLLEDLLNFVDETEAEETGLNSADAGFIIDTPQQANYVLRKVKEIRKQAEDVRVTAQQEVDKYAAKVQVWADKQLSQMEYSENYFLSLLEDYARSHIDPNGKKKSLSLIDGTVGFRKATDKYEYQDDILISALQEKHPELIEMKPSLKKAELKKIIKVKEDGVYLDDILLTGLTVTPQPEKFEVK